MTSGDSLGRALGQRCRQLPHTDGQNAQSVAGILIVDRDDLSLAVGSQRRRCPSWRTFVQRASISFGAPLT